MAMDIINKFFHIKPNHRLTRILVCLTIAVGVTLRFYAMSRGHNFDFDSYKIVGDIVVNGGNVYGETARYNYGPVWMGVLGIFREIGLIFSNPDFVFRVLIVTLLTAVDLSIAFILKKKFGLVSFILFFLNPISIVISGYHNQFDNLALLIGLCGLLVMPKDTTLKVERRHVYAAALIGLSLMTKHIFFMLPVWLFIRGKSLKVKMFMSIVPLAIFAVSFLPFWPTGHEGIVQNVFLYKSFANAPLINSILSADLVAFINPMTVLIVALSVAGFLTRKQPVLESGLWYLVVLVVFSPAVANQYLAIAMPAIIAFGVLFFVPFIGLATLLLIGTSLEGLNMQKIVRHIPEYIKPYISPDGYGGQYKFIIFYLFVGMILAAIYRYRREWYVRPLRALRAVISEQSSTLKK